MPGNERQKGLVVQPRDRSLLCETATCRIIDGELAKILGGFGSTTRVNARLLKLTNAGLLRRFFIGTSGGGQKAIYSASPQGAELVGVPHRGPRRPNNAVLVADPFVTHQLAVNRIYCTLKFPRTPSAAPTFRRWCACYEPLQKNLSLIPDGYVEMQHPEGILAAFLEADLGTERRPVWTAKTQEYLRYALSGALEAQFGQPRFRVLVITNSERRLQSIRTAVAALTEKIFWFTTFSSIESEGIWSPIWLRPKGDERHPLLPHP